MGLAEKLALTILAAMDGGSDGVAGPWKVIRPAEIAAKLLELGRVIDPPKTAELYAPPAGKRSPIRASGSSATSSMGQPIAICSMSSCPRWLHRGRPVLMFVHGRRLHPRQQAHARTSVLLRQHHAVGG